MFAVLYAVDFVGGFLFAVLVFAHIVGPERAGLRVPIETDGVAQAFGEGTSATAVGVINHDRRAALVLVFTEVAHRTDGDVHLAVLAKADSARPVRPGRNREVDDLLRRSLDFAVGVFHPQDRGIGRDVQKALVKSQAVRARQVARDNLHFIGLAVLVAVGQGDYVAFRLASDVKHAIRADGHQPPVNHVGGEDRDLESRGDFQIGRSGRRLRRRVLSFNGKAGDANRAGGRRDKRASSGEANLVHRNSSP